MRQSEGREMMSKPAPTIDPQLCRACQECAARTRCKPGALMRIEPGEMPFVDAPRCRACYVCALDCPFDAIRIEPTLLSR